MVSVWPKPSRMREAPGLAHLVDHLRIERLAGADQLAQLQAPAQAARSSWISMRHTVGGAHSVVTPWRSIASQQPRGIEARVRCR